MNTILLAYDGEPATEHALQRAGMLAKALGSRLIVVTVDPVERNVIRGGPVVENPEQYTADLDRARAYLAEEGVEADYVEAPGEPADVIAELAHERAADLVVVGTHGRTLIERLLGQSVSHAVVEKTRADVLIVH
jgi:nucleotide-binding universal stress UspA family protein